MKWGNRKYKYNKYVVAMRIVFNEMKKKKSVKPLTRMWKKTVYGDRQPFMLRTTLPEYVNFCRINGIAVCIPEKELA